MVDTKRYVSSLYSHFLKNINKQTTYVERLLLLVLQPPLVGRTRLTRMLNNNDITHRFSNHCICLPPTTRRASPQYPPALCQPVAGQMPCPRLEASTWSAKEDLDTTGGRGSRVHNRLGVAQDRSLWRSLYDPRWSSAAVSE